MARLFKPYVHGASRTAPRVLTVFLGLACAGCDAGPAMGQGPGTASVQHGQRLLAARGSQGPSLAAFGKRSYIAGRIPNTPEALARWIVASTALVPDMPMPSMGVSPAEARAMAAYLGTLR
jgi:hypothetical protein